MRYLLTCLSVDANSFKFCLKSTDLPHLVGPVMNMRFEVLMFSVYMFLNENMKCFKYRL